MFERTYYATHPEMMDGASTADLRERHVVSDLFRPGELVLVYSHGERFILGGAVPGDEMLTLPGPTAPASARGQSLLARRELGVVNIGGSSGTVEVDGQSVQLRKYEALFVPMGTASVRFSGPGARFYLVSVPAHAAFPMRKIGLDEAAPMRRGSAERANARQIHQLIVPGRCASAALCLGVTRLDPGSVWNTMPPHVHDRRSEIYLYFDMEADDRLFHFMGAPDALRHMELRDGEAAISPPWSVHMGVGTRAYSFVWAMAGENLDYEDMQIVD